MGGKQRQICAPGEALIAAMNRALNDFLIIIENLDEDVVGNDENPGLVGKVPNVENDINSFVLTDEETVVIYGI